MARTCGCTKPIKTQKEKTNDGVLAYMGELFFQARVVATSGGEGATIMKVL